MFDQLERELKEAGYNSITLAALMDIQSNKIRLTARAHSQFQNFMSKGAGMFAEAVGA